MPSNVKPIPEDFHSLTPVLMVRGAARAIEFYKNAFHARELMRRTSPEGRIIHAELRIGDSIFMLKEESYADSRSPLAAPQAMTVGIHLYVPDADAAFLRARSAGAQVRRPLQDEFWGDRCGQLTDPFGYVWTVATHQEDLSPRQIQERADRLFSHTSAI